MNIAVCVGAYQAPRVLARAVSAYREMGWRIFAHLDIKIDLATYSAEMGPAAAFVHFIPNRIPVFWGGISQVESQFLMFDAALAAGAERIVSVTDDTMPIRASSFINAAVHENIDRLQLSIPPIGTPLERRYQDFAILDHLATNPRHGGPRNLDADFFALARECDGLHTLGKKNITVYWGLAYRVLRRETIERVMAICRSDAHLWASFRFSVIPDEVAIPCTIGNYLPGLEIAGNPVFMDFSRGHGPLTYGSLGDLPRDLPAHYLFARKFTAQPPAGATQT